MLWGDRAAVPHTLHGMLRLRYVRHLSYSLGRLWEALKLTRYMMGSSTRVHFLALPGAAGLAPVEAAAHLCRRSAGGHAAAAMRGRGRASHGQDHYSQHLWALA